MTVDEFIAATRRVVTQGGGLSHFLPTVRVKTRRSARWAVLADLPDGVDAEPLARDWARKVAGRRRDYLLAVRAGEGCFRVVSRRAGVTEERLVAVEPV